MTKANGSCKLATGAENGQNNQQQLTNDPCSAYSLHTVR